MIATSRTLVIAFFFINLLACTPNAVGTNNPPPWKAPLETRLKALAEKTTDGTLGVLIHDPVTGTSVGINQNRKWYLASTVKVPVAIEVLRRLEERTLLYDAKIKIEQKQYRDGAGKTNYLKPGSDVTLKFLMEQMLIESDNTATDMLISIAGVDKINATLRKVVPKGFDPITSLLEVRQHAYKELHPAGAKLSADDFMKIKVAKGEAEKMKVFLDVTKTTPKDLKYKSIDEAFEAYYTRGYNSGTLQAFTELLLKLHDGKLLSPYVSKELLSYMVRCQTGKKRIKAGLPPKSRFAHKTGTQAGRICDMGIVTFPDQSSFTVTACVEKWQSLTAAEKTLAEVGRAMTDTLYTAAKKKK